MVAHKPMIVLLPEGYVYERLEKPSSFNYHSPNNGLHCFKITLPVVGLPTGETDHSPVEYGKELAEQWLSQLATSHTVEFRKRGTPYKSPRVPAVYKTARRCHHNTYSRTKTSDQRAGSKNTQCPMHLKLIVNKPKKEKDHNMEVHFYNDHNHAIGVPSTLSKRDVSVETEKILLELFRQGYTAAGALSNHKFTLQLQLSETEYVRATADRSIIPNIQFVDKLYRDKREEAYGSCDETPDSGETVESGAAPDHTENQERQLRKVTEAQERLFNLMARKFSDYAEDERFVKGIEKMVADLTKVKTSAMMMSFLHGVRPAKTKSSKSLISCQPTAAQKSRPELGRDNAPVPIGRPAGIKRAGEHGYTQNSKTRKKAPHNYLSHAIENDQSTKQTVLYIV